MACRVIRVSSDYRCMLVEDPPGAGPNCQDVKVYVANGYLDSGETLEPIDPNVAITKYFSGIADSMGFGEKPDHDFDSLEDAMAWRKDQIKRCEKELSKMLRSLKKAQKAKT